MITISEKYINILQTQFHEEELLVSLQTSVNTFVGKKSIDMTKKKSIKE